VSRRRSSVALRPLLALALALAAPAAAHAQEQDPPQQQATQQQTMTVTATGRVTIERPEELSERTVAAAVERARQRVAPAALRAARRQAVRLAYAAGLEVGALLTVNDPELGGTYDPSEEPRFFGPGGRDLGYCRMVTVRRRTEDGVRRVRRQRCNVPPFAARTVVATYAVTPAG
jgi:hypothetical protein